MISASNSETKSPRVPFPKSEFAQLEGVVERAREAQPAIAALSVAERLEHLKNLRRIIVDRTEEIVDAVRAETRKSRSDILMSEMFGALDVIAWHEKNAEKVLSPQKVETPLTMMGKKSELWFEPRGVAFIISPWNYPFFQAIVPIVAALAAGNAVVYKPSEHTPLEGLLESIFEEAAIAPNWVQIVYGAGDVGAAVIDQHPDMVMFTGSTATGKKIMKQCSDLLIPVDLELGGKDPMIVFEDAHIERTASGALFGALTATGQSCTSVERLYVHESIHDEFVVELVRQAKLLTQADTNDRDNDLGHMTVDFQIAKVAEHVKDAVSRGATQHTGFDWDGESGLIPPIILTDVPDDALAATDETFGPTIPVFKFMDEQDVIDRANDTPYGLTASVWSADADRARRVAGALRCGGVSINNVMATEATPVLPFGGIDDSGMGRHKGVTGLHGFCNVKSVIVDKDGADGAGLEANWYPYTEKKYEKFLKMLKANFEEQPAPVKLAKFGLFGTSLESYAQKALKERE